jgi:hypothetical protein
MGKLFDELFALKKAYDDKLEEGGEDALKEAFKELFDKHPRLESVIWAQYTPYFNDGDPCYFGVHDFDPVVSEAEDADEDEEEEEYGDTDYSYGERTYALKKSGDKELEAIAEAVSDLNGDIPDDVLEHVFGDHCKIIATREGFEVREYSHD